MFPIGVKGASSVSLCYYVQSSFVGWTCKARYGSTAIRKSKSVFEQFSQSKTSADSENNDSDP